ncbi:MAG: RAMP superfamily CRISPR-associated protein [Desulfomonilaceae bacterium]
MANGFKQRYYKIQKWTLDCEVITPMFLGNAEQKAQWRAEPFKSSMRYWWRVASGSKKSDFKDLHSSESALFGSAGGDNGEGGGKSKVSVAVSSLVNPAPPAKLQGDVPLHHPETTKPVGCLSYLAGQGLMISGTVKKTFFEAKSQFELQVNSSGSVAKDFESALSLMQAFGAVGARSRNAWGCFRVNGGGINNDSVMNTLTSCTIDWKQSMNLDYPNSLGKDDKGPLIWITVNKRTSWQETMKDIAEAYIQLRSGTTKNGILKLDPDNGERHLLGIFQSKSHDTIGGTKLGNNRYASPLRLMVRKTVDHYFGLFLHVPCMFNFPIDKPVIKLAEQIDIWETKIHRKLDNMSDKLRRASYGECL